ncbi:MAG: hypothetical protein HFI94_07605 [Lachnospiraceae bacterium]|jgi:hypothetical protein|nr:hypothetical protein [Lachnospiraceae bacterium]
MFLPIFIFTKRPNPDFLNALKAKVIPVESVREYKAQYSQKGAACGRILLIYAALFLSAFLLAITIPGPETGMLFLFFVFLLIAVCPLFTTYLTCSEILSAIEKNYPGL